MGLADRDYYREKIKEIEEEPKKRNLIWIIIGVILVGILLIYILV